MRRSGANGSGGRKMRISAGVLVLLLAVLLFACGGQTKEQTEARSEQVPSEKKTTLMIYMIGSDLESKGGEGEKDFTEIETSGVDRFETNVVVFAGGCKTWHDEKLDKPINRIRVLKEDGFETIEQLPADSMGEPDTLAYFINYAVEHFPAEHYALILWDHGGGPVKGYGRDELHGMDGLTLREMREAMEQTPFAGEKRLDWVGFDACMMASAELACLWSPYADYLVASQETEPSIGWEYGFLSDLNKVDTETFLMRLAEHYLAMSRAHFAETKTSVDKRNATLSVMDLSLAPELDAAIEAMFTAAGADVETHYDALAYSRVNTRALCRTSTGSEYDLIDLGDLALQMQEAYPDETEALRNVIGRMVLCNETNNVGLCGLSLYYPFYNKNYYLKSWADEYAALGLFPAYQAYLSDYAKIWTDGNMKTEFAFSGTPKQIREDYFTLDLTEEQAAHFASARYYIVAKEGNDYYSRVFTSASVTKKGQMLNAQYPGKCIIAVDEKTGGTNVPIAEEIEQVGDVTYYSVFAVLSDDSRPENERKEPVSVRIIVALDEKTEELSIVSVQRAEDANTRAGEVTPGRQEDIDPYAFSTIKYPMGDARFLTRENGVVNVYEDWVTDSVLTWRDNPYLIREGLCLKYDYPASGTYAIVFEITDAQNNAYCSEPLAFQLDESRYHIEVVGELLQDAVQDLVIKLWYASDNDLELRSSDGLTLRLETIQSQIYLVLENRSGQDVQLNMPGPMHYKIESGDMVGDKPLVMYCRDGSTERALLPFGYGENLRDGTIAVENLSLLLTVRKGNGKIEKAERGWMKLEEIWDYVGVYVAMEQPRTVKVHSLSHYATNQSFHGAKAEPQTVYEDENVRIDLTDLTTFLINGEDNTVFYVMTEKRSDSDLTPGIPYIVINHRIILSVCAEAGETVSHEKLREGYRCGAMYFVSRENRYYVGSTDNTFIDSIETLELAIAWYDDSSAYPKKIELCPVELSESGTGSADFADGILLYEENGVRMRYVGQDSSGRVAFIRIDNLSDRDISLEISDVRIGGLAASTEDYPEMAYTETGAGQSRICALTLPEHYALEDLSFRLAVLDITRSEVLFRSEKTVDFSGIR